MTKKDAHKAEQEKRHKIEQHILNSQNSMTLQELMTLKLDHVKLNQSKPHYQETRRYYKMLLKHAGDIQTAGIRKAHIISLLNKFSASHLHICAA